MEKFDEYVRNGRLQDELKHEIVKAAHKFRQSLRKSHKKLRKGSSNVMKTPNYTDEQEDDAEAIVTYLELINDFIRANIQEEMNEYLGVRPQVEGGTNSQQIINQSESPNSL